MVTAGTTACTKSKDSPESKGGLPAGIIAYSCKDGGARYLLGFDGHRDRLAYGAPGGTAKPNETPEATALREFHEETNCIYHAAELKLENPSESGGFTSYWMRVRFRSREEIQSSSCKDTDGAGETLDWRWVPHKMLVIDSIKPETRLLHLWPTAANSLNQAMSERNYRDPCLDARSP